MKIENSYRMVKQHALYKPTRELDKDKLFVTELNDSDIHFDLKNKIENSDIKCLVFSCTIDGFNQLPYDVLRACKALMIKYPNVSQIEFSSPAPLNKLGSANLYLALLFDSREASLKGDEAKICLNLIKSIYTSDSPYIRRQYMTDEVCNEVTRCIDSYIQSNGYSKFIEKFKHHFKTQQAYEGAVKVALITTAVVAGGFMLAPTIGFYLMTWASLPVYFTSFGFTVGDGKINFDEAAYRLQLTELYKDIGGTKDYQLWEDSKQLALPLNDYS